MKKDNTVSRAKQAGKVGKGRVTPINKHSRRFIATSVLELGVLAAVEKLADFFEEDVLELVGVERYQRGDKRTASRYGSTVGQLPLGGQKLRVMRPRVRMDGKEVTLPTYAHFSAHEQLDERALRQVVAGVASRRYKSSLETDGISDDTFGASKSAMNRRFVAITAKRLDEWLARRLDGEGEEYLVIMIDGINLGESVVIAALGITVDGYKRVLGTWEGATENAVVCQMLLNDLVQRGLDPTVSRLFVLDGAKALHKAVRDTFGKRAKVQRCQIHKIRNVKQHLPKELHASVEQAMRQAYKSSELKTAEKQLQNLVQRLQDGHPRASSSLAEGLEETLTVVDMNLPLGLRRLLASTNISENINATLRSITGNVKRWRNGRMVVRWVATGFIYAERHLRRLHGHTQLLVLQERLRANDRELDKDKKVAAAATAVKKAAA
jgi:transposase-like protein